MYILNILINGRGGSGKTEIANYLVENHGYTEIILADPIYEIAQKYFGMKDKNRKLLQDIGQNLRDIDPDIWIKYAIKIIDSEPQDKYVLSDVRQENEYDNFVEKGFVPIKVCADLDKRIERIEKRDGVKVDDEYIDRLENNRAETGADNKHYFKEIDNNGTIRELHRRIDGIVRELKAISEIVS